MTKTVKRVRVRTNITGAYEVIRIVDQKVLATFDSLYLAKRMVHVINMAAGR